MSQSNHALPIYQPITLPIMCVPDAHGRCTTCSDEALPATVLTVNAAEWTAIALINDEPAEIDISLVDNVAKGQLLLVHGGVALGKVDSE